MAQRQWRSNDTDSWAYGFGDGSDGSTYAVPSNEGCSGSSGSTSLTLAAAGSFSNGDLVLIHQTRGSGAGNWELNKIASGGGTTSLTMEHNLTNSYTDSGDNQAQIIEMKQYEDLTTGSINVPAWNGSKGGIVAFFDSGTCTVNGTINGDGDGFRSTGSDAAGSQSYAGEGTAGALTQSQSANGSGGGGGDHDGAGGGAGHANSGSNAEGGDSTNPGSGGNSAGNSGLTSMVMGGAGGQAIQGGVTVAAGGDGGAIVLIIAKEISISGAITVDGANGNDNGAGYGAGGGAGGSVLIKAQTATLGSTNITASKGSGRSSSWKDGGDGSVGRIHLDYKDSYSGSTSPTLDVTQDSTIVPLSAGGTSPMFFSSGGLAIG